ncbi:MAG: OmpH family outer membrane protein [Acidobacteria bacterium]|nr:OmpH family outer membrane protein [Acidobacteriota bacterium]
MRREILIGIGVMLALVVLLAAQAPATGAAAQKDTAPATRVAVVDFQKAVVENSEGKKAQEAFLAEVNKREKEFNDKQKAIADIQAKLQAQEKVLSDTVKADMSKQIDRHTTDLQRMNDDAQKDLGDLQQQLFRPIAERTQKVLEAYSSENGFAVVFDLSSQASNIIYRQEIADITTEIIRRVDAVAAKAPAAEPAKKAAEPAKKQ